MNQQQSLFSEIRLLSLSHYNCELTFSEYRERRNQLLDKINARYNGAIRSTKESTQLFNL